MVDSRKHVRICRMCKTEHKYCNCEEYKHLEPWHIAYCSENCMKIDGILSDYGAGLINANEAFEKLKDKDVSRKEFWGESYKRTYNEIIQSVNDKSEVQNVQVATPDVVTEQPKAEEPKVEEPKAPKKAVAKQATKKNVKTTSK